MGPTSYETPCICISSCPHRCLRLSREFNYESRKILRCSTFYLEWTSADRSWLDSLELATCKWNNNGWNFRSRWNSVLSVDSAVCKLDYVTKKVLSVLWFRLLQVCETNRRWQREKKFLSVSSMRTNRLSYTIVYRSCAARQLSFSYRNRTVWTTTQKGRNFARESERLTKNSRGQERWEYDVLGAWKYNKVSQAAGMPPVFDMHFHARRSIHVVLSEKTVARNFRIEIPPAATFAEVFRGISPSIRVAFDFLAAVVRRTYIHTYLVWVSITHENFRFSLFLSLSLSLSLWHLDECCCNVVRGCVHRSRELYTSIWRKPTNEFLGLVVFAIL